MPVCLSISSRFLKLAIRCAVWIRRGTEIQCPWSGSSANFNLDCTVVCNHEILLFSQNTVQFTDSFTNTQYTSQDDVSVSPYSGNEETRDGLNQLWLTRQCAPPHPPLFRRETKWRMANVTWRVHTHLLLLTSTRDRQTDSERASGQLFSYIASQSRVCAFPTLLNGKDRKCTSNLPATR